MTMDHPSQRESEFQFGVWFSLWFFFILRENLNLLLIAICNATVSLRRKVSCDGIAFEVGRLNGRWYSRNQWTARQIKGATD
jgi:hypothetical protein